MEAFKKSPPESRVMITGMWEGCRGGEMKVGFDQCIPYACMETSHLTVLICTISMY
jgi:hypothetical protein